MFICVEEVRTLELSEETFRTTPGKFWGLQIELRFRQGEHVSLTRFTGVDKGKTQLDKEQRGNM